MEISDEIRRTTFSIEGTFTPLRSVKDLERFGITIFHRYAHDCFASQMFVHYLNQAEGWLNSFQIRDILNRKDHNGRTAISHAAYYNHANHDILELFLKYRFDRWDEPDNEGKTPLWFALAGSYPIDLVKFLLALGARLSEEQLTSFPLSKLQVYSTPIDEEYALRMRSKLFFNSSLTWRLLDFLEEHETLEDRSSTESIQRCNTQ